MPWELPRVLMLFVVNVAILLATAGAAAVSRFSGGANRSEVLGFVLKELDALDVTSTWNVSAQPLMRA
jgi:hypothetical protein